MGEAAEIYHADQGGMIGRECAYCVNETGDLRVIVRDLLQDGLGHGVNLDCFPAARLLAYILILCAG